MSTVQPVPAFDELLSQARLTLIHGLAALQATPLTEQVPVPDAGQLPALPAKVLVQATPVLLQVPLKLQLFGEVLHAVVPLATPPQRFVEAQMPVAVQSVVVTVVPTAHFRPVVAHALTEQSAPVDVPQRWSGDVQTAAALDVVQERFVTLHLPAISGQSVA